MSKDNTALQKKVEMAAGIVVGSQNTIGVAKAMDLAGFSLEDKKNIRGQEEHQRLGPMVQLVSLLRGACESTGSIPARCSFP
jgi:hypothetical protein